MNELATHDDITNGLFFDAIALRVLFSGKGSIVAVITGVSRKSTLA